MSSAKTAIWPKQRPLLSDEQSRIMEDWYAYWLGILPNRFDHIVNFNNTYALRTAGHGTRTLEIGAGKGEYLRHEDTAGKEYYALELRQELAANIEREFPNVHTLVGDCQKRIDVPDAFFDRVIAIHVLEHLNNLPATLDEVRRVIKPDGLFSIVIPCEGGALYHLGRQFTSKRIFEKRYSIGYEWMIHYEHINTAREVIDEVKSRFRLIDREFFPMRVPVVNLNVVLGMTVTPGV
jgi:SAM-dependent methyltransferase